MGDVAGRSRVGIVSAGLGAIACAGVAVIAVTSLTPFTPGNAVVATSGLLGFVGMIGSVVMGVRVLRTQGRAWGITGIGLGVLALAAFLILIFTMG